MINSNSAEDKIAGVTGPAFAGLCATLVGIGLGRFSYVALIPALIESSWFTAGEAAYLGAANLFGYLLGAHVAHRLSLAIPAVTIIRAALVVTAVSFFACGYHGGFAWFFYWRMTAGVTGAMLMVLASPTVLAKVPDRCRGKINGIVFTGIGLGIMAAGALVPFLVSQGMTFTWLGLGAVTAFLAAVSWRAWGDAAPPEMAQNLGAPSTAEARLTRPVLLLLIAYALNAIGYLPHTIFWVDYIARGLGMSLGAGGFYWAIFGFGAACGPLITGNLADRLGFRLSLVLCLAVKGAAVMIPLVSTSHLALFASSFLVGALTPGVVTLVSGCAAEFVGRTHHRQVWGWATFTFACSQAVVGYCMAFLFDVTNSYALLFAISAVALAVGSVCAFMTRSDAVHVPLSVQNRKAA